MEVQRALWASDRVKQRNGEEERQRVLHQRGQQEPGGRGGGGGGGGGRAEGTMQRQACRGGHAEGLCRWGCVQKAHAKRQNPEGDAKGGTKGDAKGGTKGDAKGGTKGDAKGWRRGDKDKAWVTSRG